MKNLLIIISLIFLFPHYSKSQNPINEESKTYPVKLGINNPKIYKDKNGYEYLKITKNVFVNKKNFGEYNPQNITKAITYYQQQKGVKSNDNVYESINISIKEKNGRFKTFWTFNNPMQVHKNGSFGKTDFNIYIDYHVTDNLNTILHIHLKTYFEKSMFKEFILNYFFENGSWHFLSKQLINLYDGRKYDRTYCVDTTTKKNKNSFKISLNELLDFDNAHCY